MSGSVSEAGSSNGEDMSSVSAFARAAISVADNSAVCGLGALAPASSADSDGACIGSAAADAATSGNGSVDCSLNGSVDGWLNGSVDGSLDASAWLLCASAAVACPCGDLT